MDFSVGIQVVFYLVSLGVGIVIARRTLLSKTIQAQKDYIEILEKDRSEYRNRYDDLKKQNTEQELRIRFLEEMLLRGSPGVVQPRPEMGPRRQRRGDRADPAETEEDGEV